MGLYTLQNSGSLPFYIQVPLTHFENVHIPTTWWSNNLSKNIGRYVSLMNHSDVSLSFEYEQSLLLRAIYVVHNYKNISRHLTSKRKIKTCTIIIIIYVIIHNFFFTKRDFFRVPFMSFSRTTSCSCSNRWRNATLEHWM